MDILILVWKNSFRKKMRFSLTCLSVLVAFFLFTTLSGINNALSNSTSSINNYRLLTSHKISMTNALPINFAQKINAIKGVDKVSYSSWFGGFFQNEKQQITTSAVSENSFFAIHDEYQLSPAQLKKWQNTQTGIVIGKEIADKYHWHVGDNIPLSSSIWMNRDGFFTWQFTVSAIYQGKTASTDNKHIFFHHKYFDRARAYSQNSVTWITTKTNISADSDQIIKNIDEMFANSPSPTRTITEQVFIKEQAQQFVDMAMVIKIVLSAVFFTLLLIVCNTMIQIIRERLNEIAMMKAIGFSTNAIMSQIYAEAFLIIGLGALLGSLLATFTLNLVSAEMADILTGIHIPLSHYITITAIVMLAAVICCLFPFISIRRLPISQTLGAKQ